MRVFTFVRVCVRVHVRVIRVTGGPGGIGRTEHLKVNMYTHTILEQMQLKTCLSSRLSLPAPRRRSS